MAETHDYSSTQIGLTGHSAETVKKLAQSIPDQHLADGGRENDPHITVKYGLHTADAEHVRELLKDEPPIKIVFGKTSFFPNGESESGDVLKIDIDSPDLHRLNKKIADACDHTDTHPDYAPHATVAYLKPGKGKDYEGGETLLGHTALLDTLTFSSKSGKKVDIPLTAKFKPLESALLGRIERRGGE